MRALLSMLVLLACPLMMGAMMFIMVRGRRELPGQDEAARAARIAELEAELARRHSDASAERAPNS
jgi:hypothetical protein